MNPANPGFFGSLPRCKFPLLVTTSESGTETAASSVHFLTGSPTVEVPHTSVDVFVETRNVTCVDPGTSHAL
eukprot:CAMPEP_0117646932 /NCGR_PEP_ID=MMETSP0802-20121206/12350_1 /TAXON_ID=38833 /ORGANISM="Micromonas sp., Strain CCMP2099" /LENGTH=71 /DNA_ID=CAMNT_0005452417 /DNA_START=421 /DNA_END=632 /DNA_ORIENTATION=-